MNNQKHALLGLIEYAAEHRGDICLPSLVNFATDGRGPISDIGFSEIFDADGFTTMLLQLGIETSEQHSHRLNNQDMFNLGSALLRQERSENSKTLEFWRALKPSQRIAGFVDRSLDFIFGDQHVDAVVQLRIEPDWQHYVKTMMSVVEGEDRTTDYRDILGKIRNTFPDDISTLYVTCDESNVPREEINAFAKTLGLALIWKSDIALQLGPEEFCAMTEVDFQIATAAPKFIGTSRSTFANTVCIAKSAVFDDHNFQHYIYNAPGNFLRQRRDQGRHADYRFALKT